MQLTFLNTPMETFTPTHSGAIATIIWELCRQAARVGAQATVVSRSSPIEAHKDVRSIFVDYPPQPSGGPMLSIYRAQRKLTGWTHLRQYTYARRVARALRDNGLHRQKVVMFNDPEMAVFLRRQFPEIFILHWFQNQLVCKHSSRREFARSVNRCAAVSNFTSRWIAEYYHLDPSAVKTLYNAVDIDRFSPAEMTGAVPIINFVGRTGIEKAPDLLLKAAIKLTERTTNFSVQIVGSNHWGRLEVDDYQRTLQALAAQLQRKGIAVRMTGHVDRPSLPAEIRKAHIHVVPSRWDEPFGLTTLEGMACGLATVAAATGGTPEVVGQAGLLFERDSVDDLAAQLLDLLNNESRRRDVAARCRKRAEDFTWNKTWMQLTSMLGA